MNQACTDCHYTSAFSTISSTPEANYVGLLRGLFLVGRRISGHSGFKEIELPVTGPGQWRWPASFERTESKGEQ
jgi:hypothetical protein